ncbi:ABC transporter substrate binding protein [Bradyrhizobium canariense]|uniref:ABC transporter substrate binding protein n=1 Tax=Bradyrhizobium canariense TaxID=255045 RepID=UPI0013024F68|nr:ABC transporter substrate binding protein [Bradyrhizobium canariense]
MVSDEGEHLAFRQILVELIAAQRIPAGYPFREFVDIGGLMSYSVDPADVMRLMASQTADILNGKNPAEIPVYQPTKFDLAINAKTVRALGLQLSPSFLAQADQVIE